MDGRFRIDGVTGPDEYSALEDNNLYTNLMAQQNLRAAADLVKRHPDAAADLGAGPEEAASGGTRRWRWRSRTMNGWACTRRARGSPTTSGGTSPVRIPR